MITCKSLHNCGRLARMCYEYLMTTILRGLLTPWLTYRQDFIGFAYSKKCFT